MQSMEADMDEVMVQWNAEKAALERVTQKQLELERARQDLDAAQRNGECVLPPSCCCSVSFFLVFLSFILVRASRPHSCCCNCCTPCLLVCVCLLG